MFGFVAWNFRVKLVKVARDLVSRLLGFRGWFLGLSVPERSVKTRDCVSMIEFHFGVSGARGPKPK